MYYIAVMNPGGEYIFINPHSIPDASVRQWLIGKTAADYCRLRNRPMALAENRKKHIDEAVATRKLQKWEEKFDLPDGGVKYQLRHVFPVLDEKGEVKFLIGYSTEITEYKKAEEQINESEKKYRDLFNYSQAWICTHDLSGVLTTVNPAVLQALEYTTAEIIGKSLYDLLPEEDKPLFNENYLQPFLRDGKFEGVFRVVSKSGKKIFLLYQNYKLQVGENSYAIGFAQDISSRIESEKELKLAKKLADDAARAKEVFLANMSHEIRTPMTGVLGIAGLLSKTNLDEQQRNYLRLIQESANNLLLIVNDVLDLEKIIMGKLQFEHMVFSVADRVSMCLQSFTFKAEERGIQLIFKDRLGENVIVLGDPYRLSQILNNLISNAVKFTFSGSVIIETNLLQQQDDEIRVEFTVKDTGMGIAQENLELIFEPFMQANSSISRTFGGTGLGLSICRELVSLMGGELSVTSELDKGSVFSFILPFVTSTSKPNQPIMSKELNYQSLGKRNILVAEDVELNQYLARHIMESWGFDVDIAHNGREAVEMVQRNSYDLVLMDIQMPEMDGMEATRQIRKLKDVLKASIPVVALTANALKGDSEKYIAAGMNDYLSKPFDEPQLFLIISQNLKAAGNSLKNEFVQKEIPVVTPQEPAKLYDLAMVQSVSGGDEGFVKRMVQLFIDTMPPSIKELQQEVKQQNWVAVGKLAHKLKSTIDSMGITQLKQEIRTLELNGKKGEDVDVIPGLADRVTEIIEKCIAQLKNDFEIS
jgi:PAS domain S-box-containing protein